MISIHLTPDALNKTRFTYSPLIEVATSYRYLYGNEGYTAHRRWAEGAKRTLAELDLPLMHELLLGQRCIPDFLTPTPTHFETDIEAELVRVLNTPHHLIAGDIAYLCADTTPTALREDILVHPTGFLPALIDEIRLYWERVLEPAWPTLLAIVEGDITFRARQLALEGNSALLNGLSSMGTFDGEAFRLDKTVTSKRPHDNHYIIDGEGLHLVPSAFSLNHTMWQIVPQYKPMIIYGARGIGAHQAQPDLDESLELIMGTGRASVLQELVDTPATTTELAYSLHLTAGAVSQHLTLLRRAGLVSPQRSGKRVYYQLSNKGAELLRLFS